MSKKPRNQASFKARTDFRIEGAYHEIDILRLEHQAMLLALGELVPSFADSFVKHHKDLVEIIKHDLGIENEQEEN